MPPSWHAVPSTVKDSRCADALDQLAHLYYVVNVRACQAYARSEVHLQDGDRLASDLQLERN
eukprot:714033-Pyramimonas_sp.AAC.1